MQGAAAHSTPRVLLCRKPNRLGKAGFPLTDATVGDVLTEQRVVIAHAQHPEERASRISALDRVLRQLLGDLGPSVRGEAARRLFGSARGMRGTTLTARRLEAAQILERHEDHVRKQIEPKLLDELAFSFHQENLRYKPVADNARPAIAAHEDTPVATEDSYTEQEELLCRVWSAVYGYRAELIATERRLREARNEEREPDLDLKEHLDTRTWQLARLLSFVSDYLDRYGEQILQGETPFNVEGLVALAGWHGGLGGDDAKRLRYVLARAGPDDRTGFVKLLWSSSTKT